MIEYVVNSGPYPIATFETTTASSLRREFQRSVDDLDLVLDREERYAEAYFQRALSNVGLGREDDANQDIARAAKLGLDPVAINRQIEAFKKAR